MATTPFRIDLGGGHHLVGDERAGASPAYVFLHGLTSARLGEKSESLLAHAKSRGRGFLRFDLRGHGESSGVLGRVAVSELVDDAVKVLERTGPAIVVGSSLGGLVAAHAAAARPDLFRSLALLAPAFGLMPRIRDHIDNDGVMHTAQGASFFVDPRVRDDAEALDERGLPARVAVPTLLVHGTADDVIPQQVSEWFFGAMAAPKKQLWVVPQGDHRLNTVVTEIWQRVDSMAEGDAR